MFLKEFVVLFGFLNGVWLAVGVNPGAAILDVLRDIAARLGGSALEIVFTVLPIVLVAAALVLIHKRAGWWGFAAVGLAFVAGLHVVAAPVRMVVLLAGAMLVGLVATR